VAKPDTIFAWYRRLRARKFDGSKFRTAPGRPRIAPELEALIVRFVRENSGWGYDRIVGALANLGHTVSDQTVGNILRRYGIQRHVTLFHLPGDVCCPWDSLCCMNTTTELLEAALIGYEHQRQQPEEKNARRCASNWVVRCLPNTSVRHQGDDARCRQRQESGSPPHRRDVGPNGTRHSCNPGEDGDGPQCSSSNAS
jgi:hypothetical protein